MLLNRQIGFGLIIGCCLQYPTIALLKTTKTESTSTLKENKAMKKNELNEKQLNSVSGGTVEELGDLINAIYPGEEVGRPLCRAASHVPVGSSVLAATMEKDLLQFGIVSNISTGLAGTGICSKNNMYQDAHTGQALTHQQVLDRLAGK